MNNKILLSICIPTFNRANQLKQSLGAIIEATNYCKQFVEIIVSDNFSEDNTKDIVLEFKNNNLNLNYYCNTSNLGANKNFFLLTDVYAKGDYCWIIGDDDYVDNDAIINLIDILQSNTSIEFIALNFRLLTKDQYNSRSNSILEKSKRQLKYINGSYASAIDNVASQQNLLSTFISSSVFRRKPFASFSKTGYLENNWDNFKDVFPIGTILATLFHNSNSIYIKEPILSVIPGPKSWDDKIPIIHIEILPKLYEYLIEIGCKKNELSRSKQLIQLSIAAEIFANLKNKSKLSISQKEYIRLNFYSVIFNVNIIGNFIKVLLKKIKKSL